LVTATTTKSRRTQAERTAETRSRLLDATIDCIVELGYSASTTGEIARRAGLSRGAQLNHFPTRADLILAALEHLYQRRDAEFRAVVSELPPGPDRLERAIDTMWSFLQDETYIAWLELTIAARTDPELRAKTVQLDQTFHDITLRTWHELFPGDDTNPVYRTAPAYAWALLDGLALHRVAACSTDEEIDDVLTGFKAIARLLLGGTGGS
jgi:AcrR family transcriptional regulator